MRLTKPSESSIQVSYLQWLSLQYPKCFQVTFSIPNSGKRDVRFACRLKREGMKAGVPDLFMAYPSIPHHGLFIEFKKKGGRLSKNQVEFIEPLKKMEYKVIVCYNLETAMQETKEYLGVK
jgi:hypothetical protein